jgi:hypothetical protein
VQIWCTCCYYDGFAIIYEKNAVIVLILHLGESGSET